MNNFMRKCIFSTLFLIIPIIGICAQTHFTFTSNTGNNMTVLVQASIHPTIDGIALSNGDEIGVFTPAGLCVGAIVWSGSNAALTVWGDNDQTPVLDGIAVGERLFFRVWDVSISMEGIVAVAYSSGGPNYAIDGTAISSSLIAVSPPPAPIRVSPSNGATDVSITPTLGWNMASGASTYHVQVSTLSNFSSILQQDSLLTAISKTLGALPNNTTYYWKVRAINNGGASAWTSAWSFTTVNPTYTITYNGNDNTGGTVPTDSNNYQQTTTVTVLGNTGILAHTGYTFAGWNTAANGSGTSYLTGQTFTMGTANVVLYAQWNIITYKLFCKHIIGNASPIVDKDTVVNYGDTVLVTAPIIAGRIFFKWRITPEKAFLIDSTTRIAKVIVTNDSAILTAIFTAPVAIINQNRLLPAAFDFSYNSESSLFNIALPYAGGLSSFPVKICLYDVKGRLTIVLIDKEMQTGYYDLRLLAGNTIARTWSICRINAGGFSKTIKVIDFNRNH